METKYLDETICNLELFKAKNELTEIGEEKLKEFKAIKKALSQPPVSGWLHLTDEQTKILADLGSQFIYEGVNGKLRITKFGILEIFHKYNELVGNHR